MSGLEDIIDGVPEKCPECGCEEIIFDHIYDSNYKCSKCGLVFEEKCLKQELPKMYNYDEILKRKSSEVKNLTGPRTTFNPGFSSDLKRHLKIHGALSSKERSIDKAARELKILATELYSQGCEITKSLENEILHTYIMLKKKKIRIHDLRTALLGCMYLVGYNQEISNLKTEVNNYCKKNKIKIKYIRKRMHEAGLFNIKCETAQVDHIKEMSQKFAKYCNALGLDAEFEKKCLECYINIIKNGYNSCGSNINITAGAIIYMKLKAKDIKITQREIARTIKTTDVALRMRCKKLMKYF